MANVLVVKRPATFLRAGGTSPHFDAIDFEDNAMLVLVSDRNERETFVLECDQLRLRGRAAVVHVSHRRLVGVHGRNGPNGEDAREQPPGPRGPIGRSGGPGIGGTNGSAGLTQHAPNVTIR